MTADRTAVLGELRAMLREVTGEDSAWAARVDAHSRLSDDLGLDSVEVAALGELVRRRYGADLPAHLARLDLDGLLAFTVADLAELVTGVVTG
jgi:acyl carrier protein